MENSPKYGRKMSEKTWHEHRMRQLTAKQGWRQEHKWIYLKYTTLFAVKSSFSTFANSVRTTPVRSVFLLLLPLWVSRDNFNDGKVAVVLNNNKRQFETCGYIKSWWLRNVCKNNMTKRSWHYLLDLTILGDKLRIKSPLSITGM